VQTIAIAQTVQIPLLSAMLLGGCATKLVRAIRVGSMDAGLGPTTLFPMRLRRPVAMAMCAVELGLGLGLIVTAGPLGGVAAATCVRLGTGLLFLVATCALLELRAARPDVGCGCFGDFSHSPVDWRTLTRSALLSVAALTTIGLVPPPLHSSSALALLIGILAAELALIAGLSPELGEALVRLGYSEPCELRIVPTDRTLTALRRSKQWRRHVGMLTADVPVDVWRELCWRYLVFPGRHGERDAEIVFAVFLGQRRPLIHTAMVDAATGDAVPWAAAPIRPYWPHWPSLRVRGPSGPDSRPWADAGPDAGARGGADPGGGAGSGGESGWAPPGEAVAPGGAVAPDGGGGGGGGGAPTDAGERSAAFY
jgi:hypothetical protein